MWRVGRVGARLHVVVEQMKSFANSEQCQKSANYRGIPRIIPPGGIRFLTRLRFRGVYLGLLLDGLLVISMGTEGTKF